MAQFRTTADLVDAVLNRAGESTSGTSPYESDALTYLNKIHSGLIAGGLIFNVDVDDDWAWARARHPYVFKLEAPITTGTITATNASGAITFSNAPTASLENWFVRFTGEKTLYRIVHHVAANTSAKLDLAYLGTTGSKSYTAFKLDYDVLPSVIHVDSWNNKLDFGYSGSTEVTATLTNGTYTPAELATQINTQLTTSGGGSSTYGCTYSEVTRKFTLTSTTAGAEVFILYGAGTNAANSILPYIGFDYATATNSDSHTSTYALGGVSRVVAPIRCYRSGGSSKDISGLDFRQFQEDYPIQEVRSGVPTAFSIISEQPDGLHTIRFNSYPSEEMKIEVDVCEVPLDLKDSSVSIPKVPRKFADILEYGAAFHILHEKEDDKAQSFMQLAQAQLKLMQQQHRSTLKKTDQNFGQIISRPDQVSRKRFRYGYDADEV